MEIGNIILTSGIIVLGYVITLIVGLWLGSKRTIQLIAQECPTTIKMINIEKIRQRNNRKLEKAKAEVQEG